MKVSIIVPVYNVENYLEECLNSIINQSYDNIEILVIIDGSKDNSENIVKMFANKDSRIKVISRENKGLLATRLEGIKRSTGEYILFVDADDWIELDMVNKLLNIAMLHNADIVKCNYIRENTEENTRIKIDGAFKANTVINRNEFRSILYPLLIGTYYCNSCCFELIKRTDMNKLELDTNISMGEDLSLNLELYKSINKVVFIPDYLYHYRFNPSSISNSLKYDKIGKRVNDVISVYSKLYYFTVNKEKFNKKLHKLVSVRIITEATNQLTLLFFNKTNSTNQINIIKDILNSHELNEAIAEVNIFDILKGRNQYSKILTLLTYKKLLKFILVYGNNFYVCKSNIKKKIRLIIKKYID